MEDHQGLLGLVSTICNLLLSLGRRKEDTVTDTAPRSFGLNHYGSSYATGVRLAAEDADPFSNSAGRYEKVFEKDGKVIGNKGHNGHPYNG